MSATIEFRAGLRKASISHARKLIKGGDVKVSSSWSGPSPALENAYIEERGFLRYGDWFLGEDREAEPDTKARFKYPFSDDFKKVSRNGLIAIRSRAAQNDETEIFDEAGRLLELVNEREEFDAACAQRITFQVQAGEVDRDAAIIKGVTMIEVGEARGHRMMVSERTLGAVFEILEGKVLPAYVSHAGAQGDRLMDEIGAFSEFYQADGKIRSGRFEALPSFREHEPERFDRLFDLAELMPTTFGISIVFEGALFWETENADVAFDGFEDRPDDAAWDLPTINPTRIFSADFVDTPAATMSLFTEKPDIRLNDSVSHEDMKAQIAPELDESASAELERRRAAEDAAEGQTQPPAEKPKKKKAKKEGLDEELPEPAFETNIAPPCETLEPEDDPTPAAPEEAVLAEEGAHPELLELALLEYKNRIAERDVLIAGQTERIEELEIENKVFRRALAGAEVLTADGEAEAEDETDPKDAAIENYLKENPTHNRITAILEVGKRNPQIFTSRN
mgnify:CR=1 FL=1